MSAPRAHLPTIVIAAALCAATATPAAPAAPDAQQREFFEAKVRPVLAENCYSCHSSKSEKLKAGLLLDHGSTILQGGDSGPAVVPHKPDESLLVEAVRYANPDMQMPPKKKLADADIAALEEWVAMGAPWPDEPLPEKRLGPREFDLEQRAAEHWCWQPVRRDLEPPAVRDSAWPASPIDRFILAKLEENGLRPAPDADRRAWIRRVTYDLIGLPPTVADVEAFVADTSPDAFERVVDRLLGSPHFGERWARHWMDLVRYAEGYGHEFDYPIQHAHEYRDYLIRAFNADVPYDQLVREHIAGDLLDEPRRHPDEGFNESIIGTGFWFLHEATHAPTDVRGDEAGRVDNQIDVMSKTFLGVTVSCARCHDHMFDAISTKDYYALAGFLQSSRQQLGMLDPGRKIEAAAAKLRAIAAEEAELKALPETADPAAIARYLQAAQRAVAAGDSADLGAIAAEFDVQRERLETWVAGLAEPGVGEPWHPLYTWHRQPGDAAALAAVRASLEQAAARRQKRKEDATLVAAAEDWVGSGFAFEPGLDAPRLQGVTRSPTFDLDGDHVLVRVRATKGGVSARLIIDGYVMEPFNGLLFRGTRINDLDTAGNWQWIRFGGDIRLHRGRRAHIELIDHGHGTVEPGEAWVAEGGAEPDLAPSPAALRVASSESVSDLPSLALAYGWIVKRALEGEEDAPRLLGWLREYAAPHPRHSARLAELAQARSQVDQSIPAPRYVQAMVDGFAEDEAVFLRGNHRRLGEVVPRRFLTALGGEHIPAPEVGSGRESLAAQIVDPANPLTSRVIVNRLWHHIFGAGIVPTTDDFGVLGQPPSHPLLLDHLAASFVDDAWSIKRQLRRLVLSRTYRMSSRIDPEAHAADPTNRLLHRANVKRLQAEAIRDGILAVSGRLDPKLFGAPVPLHLTPFMTGRGRPGSGPLDGAGRRSIYGAVKRNFLSPMMIAFDRPIPFSTMGRRATSNVPAQALMLMNDPFVVGQAEFWAKRVLAENMGTPETVTRMYLEAFARPPSPPELEAAAGFLGEGREVALWKDFAHVLINTKEFIFIE